MTRGNMTKVERVRSAARKLGPHARLHDIAFEARLTNRATAAMMRQIGATSRRGKTLYEGLGGCSEWTLPAGAYA